MLILPQSNHRFLRRKLDRLSFFTSTEKSTMTSKLDFFKEIVRWRPAQSWISIRWRTHVRVDTFSELRKSCVAINFSRWHFPRKCSARQRGDLKWKLFPTWSSCIDVSRNELERATELQKSNWNYTRADLIWSELYFDSRSHAKRQCCLEMRFGTIQSSSTSFEVGIKF